MKLKLLLFSNFLTFVALVAVLYREGYLKMLLKKIGKSQTETSKFDYKNTQKFRHETALHEVYKKKSGIVMLGNSLAFRVNWNELLDRCDIISRGVGGDITEGFLARLDGVIKLHPTICFVNGGG